VQQGASTKPGLVLLGGDLADFSIAGRAWAFIVAADGGARHALRQGVLPDHVVGDFDSLAPEDLARLKACGVPVARLPRAKDLTDGEAALRWALARSDAGFIVIAGGLGDRFDHSLGSLALLEQLAAAGRRGCVTDGRQTVYLLADGLLVPGEAGDVLSIVPLTPQVTGVSVTGVRWPLEDATLTAASTLTISNELTEPPARFSLKEGRAVVVHIPKRVLERGEIA